MAQLCNFAAVCPLLNHHKMPFPCRLHELALSKACQLMGGGWHVALAPKKILRCSDKAKGRLPNRTCTCGCRVSPYGLSGHSKTPDVEQVALQLQFTSTLWLQRKYHNCATYQQSVPFRTTTKCHLMHIALQSRADCARHATQNKIQCSFDKARGQWPNRTCGLEGKTELHCFDQCLPQISYLSRSLPVLDRVVTSLGFLN